MTTETQSTNVNDREDSQSTKVSSSTSKNSTQELSRPVFRRVLELHTVQAQKIMRRSYDPTCRALFNVNVILRIIGEKDHIDEVNQIIVDQMDKVTEELSNAIEQMDMLLEQNGIEGVMDYTAPEKYETEIATPDASRFTHLVVQLENLIKRIDTLWFNSVFSSQQRTDMTYQWQQRLFRLAGRIIGIEKRARVAAYAKGKGDEVEEAAPGDTPDEAISSEETSTDVPISDSPKDEVETADSGPDEAEKVA